MLKGPISIQYRDVHVIPQDNGKISQEYLVDGAGRELEPGEPLAALNELAMKEYRLLSELRKLLVRAHGKSRGWTRDRLAVIVERELKEDL